MSKILGLGFILFGFLYLIKARTGDLPDSHKEEKATMFAAKACSCFGDTKLITFREKEFDFTCQDGTSYGKFIPYSMEYSGEFCKP